tara:strand:- start:9660 stop:10289 length:630 start_codon:yes stop_codon:yes gene_type:complete
MTDTPETGRMSLSDADATYAMADQIVLAALVSAACDIRSNPILMMQALIREITAAVSLLCGAGQGERFLAENAALYSEHHQQRRRGLEPDTKKISKTTKRLHRLMDHLTDQAECSDIFDRFHKWPEASLVPDWIRVLARLHDGLAPDDTECLLVTCQLLPDGQPDPLSIQIAEPGRLDRTGNLMLMAAAHAEMHARYLDLALAPAGGTA